MNRSTWLGLAAGLHSAVSVAQPVPSDAHHHKPSAAPKSEAPTPRTSPRFGYESAFTDYRRFVADEPLKDWRAANEEVAESARGGGAMKPMPAMPGPQSAAPPGAKP